MSWTAYQVVFRLLTPMHMGAAKLGNLQTTRLYIHGKALWGGLTERLTRDAPNLGGDYAAVGRRVNEELAFSYFFPSTSDQVELWPWDDPDQFAWRFLGSYASTALNYNQNSAQEGSLHETEYIAPTTRDGRSVNLVGYVFAKKDCALPWTTAAGRLQVGGERTYGWGRLELTAAQTTTTAFFDSIAMTLDGARPCLHPGKDAAMLAHALATGDRAVAAHGSLAPLVGRETRSAGGHGRYVSAAKICWEPGSKTDSAEPVIIGSHGIWETAAHPS